MKKKNRAPLSCNQTVSVISSGTVSFVVSFSSSFFIKVRNRDLNVSSSFFYFCVALCVSFPLVVDLKDSTSCGVQVHFSQCCATLFIHLDASVLFVQLLLNKGGKKKNLLSFLFLLLLLLSIFKIHTNTPHKNFPLMSLSMRRFATSPTAANAILAQCRRRFTTKFPHPSSVGAFDSARHGAALRRDGIVCIENFVPGEVADRLREDLGKMVDHEAQSRRQANQPNASCVFNAGSTAPQDFFNDAYFLESGDKVRYFLEKGQTEVSIGSLNKVAHGLHVDQGPFQAFTSQRCFGSIARQLGLQHPSVVQSMYILKPPKGVGTSVQPHQDSTWIHTSPHTCIAMWIALDDCTVENSCLLAKKGSHLTHVPLSARCRLIDGKSVLTGELPKVELTEMEPLPCPKGSLVIFNGEVVHGSTDNMSNLQRHAYVFHMVDDGAAVWSSDNWFGKHLARLAI